MPFVATAALLFASVPLSRPPAAPPAAPPTTPSACAAVTRADVENGLGLRVGAGQERTDDAASICDYAGRNGQVTVTIQRISRKLDIAAEQQEVGRAIPGSTFREAPGLGDVAFFIDIPGAGTQLCVIRHARDYVMVSVLGFGAPRQVSRAAEAMARAALRRL